MPRDTSLDDFLGDDGGDDDGADDAGDGEPAGTGGGGDGGPPEADESTPDPVGERSGESETGEDDGSDGAASETDPGDWGNDPDGSDDATGREGPPVDPSAVGPARPTYGWTPGGAECADCGATVDRRWRGDGTGEGSAVGDRELRMVCADCKEW